MTFDTHLISEAMLALGICAVIAIAMALAITGIAATQKHQKPSASKSYGSIEPARLNAQAASGQQATRDREPQAA